MKKQKSTYEEQKNNFDLLSEEVVLSILDRLGDNPLDKKSFSLVCKSFYAMESRHRKNLRPLRPDHLRKILNRYPHVNHLDLSLCPRITDTSLTIITSFCKATLRSINLSRSRSRSFTHAGLSILVMNCVNLVELDLSNATELNDLAASAIAEAKNLEKLWLVRCKSVTDIGVGCFAVGCRKLKQLNLKWCVGVTDLGVDLIAVKCKELRSLDLSYLPITGKCLPGILELQFLEDLVLQGCYGVDNDCLANLKLGGKSLKSLDMSSCQNVSHKGLSSLTSGARSLQHLALAYGSPVTLAFAHSLQTLKMLHSINLDSCQITCAGLKAIGSSCLSLQEISLRKCMGVTDEGLASLVAKQKDLRKLDITCSRKITCVVMDDLTNSCASLTSLKMESCTLVPREAFSLIGERCQFLEELDLTDNEVDDAGLRSISRCSRLSSLKLGLCLNITDAGLVQIGINCPNLIELDLYRCDGITDMGVSAIAQGCTGLEMINIAYGSDLTDSSLVSLSKCPKLNTLESRGCPLVTSLGLAAIAVGCKQLTKLDIKMCQNIDDAGMIPLAHSAVNLRQINLSYTSVTDVGLLSLANVSCLQNITVLHLKSLTPTGVAAALLACEGLTKVKLQTAFKSLLPQPLFAHLEARGCVFQWRDKMVQAQVDPKCWKLQLYNEEE